ncbi:MAG: c-type cytochrome domain-containing protein, partial [bacterium]
MNDLPRTSAGVMRTLPLVTGLVAALSLASQAPVGAQAPVADPAVTMNRARARAMLDRYCVVCHNERTRTADLTLDTLDLMHVGQDADSWEHVVRRLRASAMPPAGRPRPDAGTTRAFVGWLESALDRDGLADPDPGR